MSLATWQVEFYPTPAAGTAVTDAAIHSLRKWRGLTCENLSRHDVRRGAFGSIEDVDGHFPISTETCALCSHFWEDVEDYDYCDEDHHCGDCPLARARGGIACDDEREGETCSPYQAWVERGDPQPMILWLEQAMSVGAVDPANGIVEGRPRAPKDLA